MFENVFNIFIHVILLDVLQKWFFTKDIFIFKYTGHLVRICKIYSYEKDHNKNGKDNLKRRLWYE